MNCNKPSLLLPSEDFSISCEGARVVKCEMEGIIAEGERFSLAFEAWEVYKSGIFLSEMSGLWLWGSEP
jgi:hypothetical protein